MEAETPYTSIIDRLRSAPYDFNAPTIARHIAEASEPFLEALTAAIRKQEPALRLRSISHERLREIGSPLFESLLTRFCEDERIPPPMLPQRQAGTPRPRMKKKVQPIPKAFLGLIEKIEWETRSSSSSVFTVRSPGNKKPGGRFGA